MINREDMLELTRRMTLSRTSFTRIAGCYVDAEGEYDGSFNTNFLKLSPQERKKHLEIAKVIPFSETNVQCGLKNDALMETFYDVVMENYYMDSGYAVYMFHDRYDIPAKAADKERLGESEEMFEYLICAVCPLLGSYEPGKPECGFLFPAFTDRAGDLNHVNIYSADPRSECIDVMKKILGI